MLSVVAGETSQSGPWESIEHWQTTSARSCHSDGTRQVESGHQVFDLQTTPTHARVSISECYIIRGFMRACVRVGGWWACGWVVDSPLKKIVGGGNLPHKQVGYWRLALQKGVKWTLPHPSCFRTNKWMSSSHVAVLL